MVRQILLVAVLLLVLPSLARAQEADPIDTFKGLAVDAGFAWASNERKFVNTETFQLIKKDGWIVSPSLDVGYATNDNFIIGASFSLLSLEKLGVKIPILKNVDVRPRVSYGWGNINLKDIAGSKNNVMYGASVLNIKF